MKLILPLFWAMFAFCACGGVCALDGSSPGRPATPGDEPEIEKLADEKVPSESPWNALIEPRRLSGPAVLVSETTGVEERSTQLTLTASGAVVAEFEIVVANSSKDDAEVELGFAWKTPRSQCAEPPAPLVAESGEEIPWIRQDTISPPRMQEVFCLSVFHATASIPGGSSRRFRTGMFLRAERHVGLTTVLGFEDSFRHNLSRFSWSHSTEDLSTRSAPALEEAFASFFPKRDTNKPRLTITCSKDLGDCLRGVAFDVDQDGAARAVLGTEEMSGAPRVSFSWSLTPGDAGAELALVKELLGRHPEDLRLRARLLTLLRCEKAATSTLLEVCTELLEHWTDARAQEQLLTGRNDHRSAAYGACLEIGWDGGDEHRRIAQRLEDDARSYIAKRRGGSSMSLSDAMLLQRLDKKAPDGDDL